MLNSIISNKPTIFQFGSHIQYLVAESVASTAFVCCKAKFTTKAFNFDCPHTIHITTKVIIIVINVAMKRSTSTRKLSRKEPNLELILASFIFFCSFFSIISFLYLYWVTKSFIVLGALSSFGLNSKLSTEIGKICSWVFQFVEMEEPKSSLAFSRWITKAKFTVKYITSSALVLSFHRLLMMLKENYFQLPCYSYRGCFCSSAHMGG